MNLLLRLAPTLKCYQPEYLFVGGLVTVAIDDDVEELDQLMVRADDGVKNLHIDGNQDCGPSNLPLRHCKVPDGPVDRQVPAPDLHIVENGGNVQVDPGLKFTGNVGHREIARHPRTNDFLAVEDACLDSVAPMGVTRRCDVEIQVRGEGAAPVEDDAAERGGESTCVLCSLGVTIHNSPFIGVKSHGRQRTLRHRAMGCTNPTRFTIHDSSGLRSLTVVQQGGEDGVERREVGGGFEVGGASIDFGGGFAEAGR